MDWPFETIIPNPHPRHVCGVAEIVGQHNGFWHVGQIYVNTGTWRIADYDEHREIEMRLHLMAGGEIGRAYRASLREQRHEHC